MSVLEIFLIAVALSMDAFAVSIGKGLSVRKTTVSNVLSVGLWFGGFQALMTLIGYYLGSACSGYVEKADHWIAFALLFLIGLNMIRECLSPDGDNSQNSSFAPATMLILAVATSIDALAAGISFAMVSVRIYLAVTIIGCTTFVFSVIGLKTGNFLGSRFQKCAGILGGLVLIGIGIKILAEHLS